jgi:hypothetical protein
MWGGDAGRLKRRDRSVGFDTLIWPHFGWL